MEGLSLMHLRSMREKPLLMQTMGCQLAKYYTTKSSRTLCTMLVELALRRHVHGVKAAPRQIYRRKKAHHLSASIGKYDSKSSLLPQYLPQIQLCYHLQYTRNLETKHTGRDHPRDLARKVIESADRDLPQLPHQFGRLLCEVERRGLLGCCISQDSTS